MIALICSAHRLLKMSSLLSPCFNCYIFVCSLQETQNLNNFRNLVQLWLSSLWWVTQQLLSKSSWKIHLHLVCISLFLLKLNSSSLVAHNHEHLERAHSICLASHQRIIAAIEFPSAAHELLFSPHIFVWEWPLKSRNNSIFRFPTKTEQGMLNQARMNSLCISY